MPFSAWSENDPQGSDAASSINEAATRAAVRIRERLATVFPDWASATDRIHMEKIFINSSHLTVRDDTDAATLASLTSAGILTVNNQPRCRVRKTSFSITPANTYVPITFDAEDFDVASLHDNAVNNTRITIPTNGGGIYLFSFSGQVSINATNFYIRLFKNGTTVEGTDPACQINLISNELMTGIFCLLVNAAAADYFEVQVKLDGTTGTIANNQLNVAKLF